jgi:rubrerythrin
METSCSPELRALKTAIITEHEGYNFYLMAAEKSKSEETRNVFTYLANEEKKHEHSLKKLYESIAGTKFSVSDKELQCAPIDTPDFFTPDKLKQEDPSLIVSALSMATRMEQDSIDFYKEAANKTTMENAKDVFNQLVSEEEEHLAKLTDAYDFARDEWWSQQGFSPA